MQIWMRGNRDAELSEHEMERYRYLANDFILLYQVQYQQYLLVGRDVSAISAWLISAFRDRPGLRKHLKRIIDVDPETEFARTIRELFPELRS